MEFTFAPLIKLGATRKSFCPSTSGKGRKNPFQPLGKSGLDSAEKVHVLLVFAVMASCIFHLASQRLGMDRQLTLKLQDPLVNELARLLTVT